MSDVHHFPPELSSFVGRAKELAAISDLLAAGQLLTLVGPGGCGKSRLAIKAGLSQAGVWPDGVFWVGLENETDDHQVIYRFAEALDVLLAPGADPLPALVQSLVGRELLVVADNCEQVVGGAARVLTAILSRCPQVALLATSRATLGIDGERVWRMSPMALPDAHELYLERASMSDARTDISADVRAGARRICDRLDRLPLAIELAAGWAGTLTPAQIADSLKDPYALLEGGSRTAGFRQQTLVGSMQWSHDLLDDDERVLFRRLGVFEAGFTSDAVSGMAVLGGPAGPGLLKVLRDLIDKSLVVADTTGAEARYRMLGVIRAYALAKLNEAHEAEAASDCHLAVYLSLVEGLAPLLDTDKDAWRSRVGPEYPNIRAAIEWGLSRDDPNRGRRLAAATAWLWHLEARGSEGLRLLRLAAECGAGEQSPLQAQLLVSLALVADTTLSTGEGYKDARAAQEMAADVGAAATERLASALVAIERLSSDLEGARDDAIKVRDDATRAGDGFVADSSEALIGLIHMLRDEYRDAIDHLESAVDGLIQRGDRGVASSSLAWLALAVARTGELTRAADLADRAITTAEPLRDLHRSGMARSVLAEIRAIQGRPDDAAAALAPIDSLVEGAERAPFIPGWERARAMLALADGRPGEAVEWCRKEGHWQAEQQDEQLVPDTQLVLAAALREAGNEPDAWRVLELLSTSLLNQDIPRIRADILDQEAFLARTDNSERALGLHHQALRIRIDHDLVLGCISSLEALALISVQRGKAQVAGILAGAAEQARKDIGAVPEPSLRELREWLHTQREETAVAEAIEQGRTLKLSDAAAYAARARGPRRRPDTGWESLTPTERSVVELAVEGLSNPEIASRLFVSRGTVKTHLAHVYAKLHIANRTELARAAAERSERSHGRNERT
jgi:predicted ATPase/DNA-binding CsgD family transcriptional regulator